MQNIDTIDTVYAIDALAAETGQSTATISDLVKLIQATYDAEGNQLMEDGEFFAEFDNWFK